MRFRLSHSLHVQWYIGAYSTRVGCADVTWGISIGRKLAWIQVTIQYLHGRAYSSTVQYSTDTDISEERTA